MRSFALSGGWQTTVVTQHIPSCLYCECGIWLLFTNRQKEIQNIWERAVFYFTIKEKNGFPWTLNRNKGQPWWYIFNPSTWEAEESGACLEFCNSSLALSTQRVPGQLGLHNKTLISKKKVSCCGSLNGIVQCLEVLHNTKGCNWHQLEHSQKHCSAYRVTVFQENWCLHTLQEGPTWKEAGKN